MDRRTFISVSVLLPFFSLRKLLGSGDLGFQNKNHLEKMTKDVNKILDIHPSLDYRIISKEGSKMSDGFKVPALADGMGSFKVDDKIVLVRNHELDLKNGTKRSAFYNMEVQVKELGNMHYDNNAIGGTTNIVLDKSSKNVIKEYLSLSGTHDNCSGGVTPWGTWLTCEENIRKKKGNTIPHGYVFEVDPKKQSLNNPVPLKNMGRFYHEAVAFDKFQNAYLTEDRSDGLIYKFVPKKLNSLNKGELFALKIKNKKDSRNWSNQSIEINKRYSTEWVKIEDVDPDDDTMRYEGLMKGATPFSRPEGIISGKDSLYICCTSGGPLKRGQIWKINPINKNESYIELWYEIQDKISLNMPDNIVVAPWGDLIVCEDNSKINRLWGITTQGKPYLIAQNSYSGAEFAGVCFSPFDNTLFVNLQQRGITLAIDGNWDKVII